MSIQFIGMIQSQKTSEIHPASGPVVDPDYVTAFAQAHEAAGFDRILVPHHSTGPSAQLTIAHAAAHTSRIGFLLAHRPGFVAPTLAARELATLDQFTAGRLALHVISGGSDAEQRRDGDYLDHDQRYERTDEYVGLLRRLWTSDQPFDHAGTHYRFDGGFSEVKPRQQPHIPVFFGGASDAALPVAGKHADVYALWTEIARETGARHNSTALVGTPEQVAEALLDYHDLGVTTFLIRGFDPLEDAIDYGRELIPRTRALVEQRLAQRQAA